MKLLKTDNPYLTKDQWRKVFLAMSIMTIVLYIIAMIFSLCGSNYFILNYQNEQMDNIQNWLVSNKLYGIISWAFSTLEFFIISTFVTNKRTRFIYCALFYVPIAVISHFIVLPSIVYTLIPLVFYLGIPVIELKLDKRLTCKNYLWCVLRVAIAVILSLGLQVIIYAIKDGKISFENHIMNLSSHFIYAIEYDIALSVVLFTISLYINREKGDSKIWTTFLHSLGGFSQTSKTQLQKSSTKNLTKAQKNKIRLFYIKLYCIQLGTFLLVMVLPFLLGKVLEFLVMYLAFCVARAILGFKYSLHYKKESLCATVGVVVFGILSLAVPFFYVVLIIAVTLGVGLAILLHLSYKYKGFYLFNKIAKPDKFAELYVIMDGDLSRHHVEIICKHRGLAQEETSILLDFAEGNKKSYIAHRHHYDLKTIERRINTAIDKLHEKD